MITGYLAPAGYENQLLDELKDVTNCFERLILARGPPQKTYWAQNIWYNVETLPFSTISEAAEALRKRGALWSHLPYQALRRAALISQKLPYFSCKPLAFFAKLPDTPTGAWTLLGPNEMLAASKTSSPFPHGEYHFLECKEGPPSRAYLKLWEALTRLQIKPKKGDLCLEIGASPGSWTWALQKMGAKILAFDKAPLNPEITMLEGVEFSQKDAFALFPKDFPNIDWVFCDVIAYPEKLLSWIKLWLMESKANFLCTIKFQGKDNYSVIKKFAEIEGSEILHLFHNKHELTWFRFI